MQTRKRPKSLTVIAVIFIVFGALAAILSFASLLRAERASLNLLRTPESGYLWGILIGAGQIISGIAVLKGLNWGRWLYLCIYPLFVVVNFLVYGLAYGRAIAHTANIITVPVYYIISLIILTRPAASEFFRKETVDE